MAVSHKFHVRVWILCPVDVVGPDPSHAMASRADIDDTASLARVFGRLCEQRLEEVEEKKMSEVVSTHMGLESINSLPVWYGHLQNVSLAQRPTTNWKNSRYRHC